MNPRPVWKIRNHRCVHIDESPTRMLREDMASTCLAPFAGALRRLVVRADVVRAPRDLHGPGFPQDEGIDRTGRPMPTGFAVAIAHRGRLTGHGELNRATEAAAFVRIVVAHDVSPRLAIHRHGQSAASDSALVPARNAPDSLTPDTWVEPGCVVKARARQTSFAMPLLKRIGFGLSERSGHSSRPIAPPVVATTRPCCHQDRSPS